MQTMLIPKTHGPQEHVVLSNHTYHPLIFSLICPIFPSAHSPYRIKAAFYLLPSLQMSDISVLPIAIVFLSN